MGIGSSTGMCEGPCECIIGEDLDDASGTTPNSEPKRMDSRISTALDQLQWALVPHATEDCSEKTMLAAVRRLGNTLASITYEGAVGMSYRFALMPVREESEPEHEDGFVLCEPLAAICGVPDKHRATVDRMSRNCPFARPKWMGRDEYEAIIGRSYEKSLTERVCATAETADADPLTAFVRGAVRMAFGPVKADKLFGPHLPPKVSRDLWESIITIHAYDLVLTLRGHQGDLLGRSYGALASGLTQAIPLGIKPQPNPAYCHWMVVTA